VAICLFDVIVASNVSKFKKKIIFLYFFKCVDILPIFVDVLAINTKQCFLDPWQSFRRYDFCNFVYNK
jgi:hypothetical protein